jgi:hypothetical protein
MGTYVSHHPLPENYDGLVYHALPACAKANAVALAIRRIAERKNLK